MTDQKQNNHLDEPTLSAGKTRRPISPLRKKQVAPFALTFLIMFSVWILLSGKFDVFHLSLGLVSCTIVSIYTRDLLFPALNLKELPRVWLRFIRYLPWLLYQVFVANIHVLYLACHPRMIDLIDPQIISFKSRLKSDLSLVTLANSITLTPGTITVYVSIFGDVTFHAIDFESGQSLPWIMDARIAEIFGE